MKPSKTTLPETNTSPLKIGLPKEKVVFQPSIFRRYVSFSEDNGFINQSSNRFQTSDPGPGEKQITHPGPL